MYGQTHSTTAAYMYGGDSVEGYEAGDDCAAWALEEGIPIQVEPQAIAWASGFGAAEIQDVHLCERVFLART